MNVVSLQVIEFGVASGYEIDGVDNTRKEERVRAYYRHKEQLQSIARHLRKKLTENEM